ncbi:MAG: peptide-methionine (R)-S-oxide reductase, partial [Pseudomonadota bacterium]
MLTWKDILEFAHNGNPTPPRRVEKSPSEWQAELEQDTFYVTRLKGTERPHSSDSCTIFEPGQYVCVCCDNLLFDG